MPDFEEAKRNYAAARAAQEKARAEMLQAREKVKRVERDAEKKARHADLHDRDEGVREAESELNAARRAYRDARSLTVSGNESFSTFTDPRVAVSRMPDDVPIAFLPLRLETRFKTVKTGNSTQLFLCVRVFPDDVLVDTFQPQISQSEFDNVVIYWMQRWRAAGKSAGHRAAWAKLVRAHGAGRAKWLIDQITPANPLEEPTAATGDHILLIRPSSPIPNTEKAAISDFWKRIWSTSGLERDQAFADLKTSLGNARAVQVEAELEPVNLRDIAIKPDPALNVAVAFLDLPQASTLSISQEAWTRAAHSWLLPERLMLLGFRGRQQILSELGKPIPGDLQVGPDPAADDDEQIKADDYDLDVPEALLWTVDFDEAVTKGMGFNINLTERGISPPFDRLFVLGVRVGSDATEGTAELSDLIANHQASRKGFSILPQGRPTNNTDVASAGHTWWEDPDESFRHFFEIDPSDNPTAWQERKDGAWLAGLLGVSSDLLRASPHYYLTDQAEARAMNIALWPATLGYYMEQMLEPVFSDETVQSTREFFNRFVIGRGTVPSIRIGRQPYGVLPSTVWSKMSWWNDASYARNARALGLPGSEYLTHLFNLVQRGVEMWTGFAVQVPHVGAPGPEPQQTLLDIVGLHPTSAEFYQRYSQSFTQHYNALGLETELVSAPVSAKAKAYIDTALATLAALGWNMPAGSPLPELLEKIFLKRPNLLKGELVEIELSDKKTLTVTRADGRNYIDWLQWAARTSHDTLREQEGFATEIPRALLYLFLHHALDLGFLEADLSFRRDALQMTDVEFKAQRKEPKFIHVAEGDDRSRWDSLYRAEPAVTGDPVLRMGEYISTTLLTRNPYLNAQLSSLEILKNAATGALERAFVEHIDCLTYRMDAWRMGMHAVQLSHMRHESTQGFAKAGIYTGAYGWLENVQPETRALESVPLDGDLADIFASADEPPLMHDPSNYGHIHAPSLDQAVTAAILRNGHLANATPQAPDLLAVDLSSERVRWAQKIIEGIRNGQSLGALLGYRLERALHDEPSVYLDELIYRLRAEFPLAGNRNEATKQPVDDIAVVEARNVVDGAAFVDHIAERKRFTYPYEVDGLPSLSDLVQPGSPNAAQIGLIIDECVAEVRRLADSVADLALAEGVYQLVRGNYDRAAGTLDAFSKGTYPPIPEVASTPRAGRSLTHRVALHLEGGLLSSDPQNTTPRAKGEPALAQWLNTQLPDQATIFARVSWHNEASNTDGTLTPSMADLGLARVDMFYMLDAGGARDMPGFDDLLIDFAEQNGAPSPEHDAVFSLEYKAAGTPGLTLFEIAPLARALRGLVLGSRALRPSDFSLQNEATSAEDDGLVIRSNKAQAALTELQSTASAVTTFITDLEADIGEGIAEGPARDAARDNIDTWLDDYASAVRPVMPFGLQAASLTTGVEGRRARFTTLIAAIDEIVDRWMTKQDEYDDVMDAYGNLTAAATNEERIALLISAARIVSTTVIAPLPSVANLESQVALLRTTFDTALTSLIALRAGATKVGATLISLTAFVPVMQSLDATPVDLGPFRDSVFALANDLLQKARFLRDDIAARIKNATDALTRAAGLTGDKAQGAAADAAKSIFGDAFILLPEFTLDATRLAEWNNVWNNRADLLTHLETGPDATSFPVDDWLHGIARVRERLRHLEMTILLGEALSIDSPPLLEALQFPHRTNDSWLGLRFPATFPNGTPFTLDEDKLLYSAVFSTGSTIDPTQPAKTYSALLIDEWVEVIPTDKAATGLSFHFNRPNAEAPQAILLATPPVHRGAWEWQDIVDTMHETLDFARLRAVEPKQVDESVLAPLLPAVLASVTTYPITSSLNLGFNNDVHIAMAEAVP